MVNQPGEALYFLKPPFQSSTLPRLLVYENKELGDL